ncbi:MAG: hypothetical protein F4Z06_11215, partial [Acidimicrobiia bacterium]|nr:hypothetical protein [Acidimicrobiia bacterium]
MYRAIVLGPGCDVAGSGHTGGVSEAFSDSRPRRIRDWVVAGGVVLRGDQLLLVRNRRRNDSV